MRGARGLPSLARPCVALALVLASTLTGAVVFFRIHCLAVLPDLERSHLSLTTGAITIRLHRGRGD